MYESYVKQLPLNLAFIVSTLVHCAAVFIEFHLLNVVCLDVMEQFENDSAQYPMLNRALLLSLPSEYQQIVNSNWMEFGRFFTLHMKLCFQLYSFRMTCFHFA